jgi:hypothetical protein
MVGKEGAREMTELEREIFMRLLIDLFLERPAIERRLKEKQGSMSSRTETGMSSHHSQEDFSKKPSIFPISPSAN